LEVQPWMNNGIKDLDTKEGKLIVLQLNEKIHHG
jgi:hypothetical protein